MKLVIFEKSFKTKPAKAFIQSDFLMGFPERRAGLPGTLTMRRRVGQLGHRLPHVLGTVTAADREVGVPDLANVSPNPGLPDFSCAPPGNTYIHPTTKQRVGVSPLGRCRAGGADVRAEEAPRWASVSPPAQWRESNPALLDGGSAWQTWSLTGALQVMTMSAAKGRNLGSAPTPNLTD